jgi:hypothetical protein
MMPIQINGFEGWNMVYVLGFDLGKYGMFLKKLM